MKVNYVGKNITIRNNFKEEVQKKIDRMDKYFDEDVEATVVLSTEGNSKRVEITIPMTGSKTILRADQSSFEMLESVDACIDSLVSQVRKYKTKLIRRFRSAKSRDINFEAVEDLPEEDREEAEIVRVKEIDVMPMTPEEAVLQMNLLGHDFFLFLNMEDDTLSVVYKRKAGNYGMILPREGTFVK